jgi:hypothetical protein
VQRHLRGIRAAGGIVNRSIVLASARGVLRVADGRNVDLNRGWAASLLKRMGYVRRKGTRAAKKVPSNIEAVSNEFHSRVKSVVQESTIPSEFSFFVCLLFFPLNF